MRLKAKNLIFPRLSKLLVNLKLHWTKENHGENLKFLLSLVRAKDFSVTELLFPENNKLDW